MGKVMNELYLDSDLEYAQNLLGEDMGYQTYLTEMDNESRNQLEADNGVSKQEEAKDDRP